VPVKNKLSVAFRKRDTTPGPTTNRCEMKNIEARVKDDYPLAMSRLAECNGRNSGDGVRNEEIMKERNPQWLLS
jgi:hypothetical protein